MKHRIVATTLVASCAALGLAVPAGATRPTDPLQQQVNAIQRTGTVAVVAQSTGPNSRRTATAGVADTESGDAARPGDKFRIASATKTYAATVILQLAGERRLSLDDTVERRLPGVVSGNGNDGSKITIRQLLNHTSGLFNYTADFPAVASKAGFEADRYRTWTDAALVNIAMRHAPDFQPGARWAYSNTNYVLAGMIIKSVTGHTWQHEVTRRIIRPLGLRHTTTPTTGSRIPGRHLHGYSTFGEPGPALDTTLLNPSMAGAAGAMISTTDDMSRFYQALLGGRLLRPAQLAEMKTTVRAAELDEVWPGARYGLGLAWIPLSCSGGYYGHPGDLPGYATRDGVSADGRRVVVLNATGDGSAPDLATFKAANSLIDQQLCQ